MRLCLRSLAPLAISTLALLVSACDDSSGSVVDDGGSRDGGASPDGGGGGGPDVPPATGACPGLTPTGELKGSIEADATWRGVLKVSGDVIVSQPVKITIEAGTTFVMESDSSIEFGWNSNAASVFARGTAAAPIRFCGKAAQAGYFDRIIVGAKVTSDSVLENVIISDGGQATRAALELNAPVLVNNVQVLRSGAEGVVASDFKDGSQKLTVMGAAKIGVALLTQGAVTHLPLGGGFRGNGTDVVALRLTEIDADTTFHDPGVPYVQERGIIIRNGATITFEAGVDYRLAVDQRLEFGWNSDETTVKVNGTAEKPVLFGKTGETAGGYQSIIIGNRVRSDSVLRNMKVRGGGNGGPALHIKAPLTIDHLTLENNQTGLKLEGTGFSSQSTALSITGTSGGPPATVTPDNAITIPAGGTFAGNNGKDWIAIEGGDFTATGTLRKLDVPWRVQGDIRSMDMSALTIEAGTTILMAADTGIEFGWNSNESTITAVGSADKPIVFKGAGDVTAMGYWDGLIVGSRVSTSSKFSYVQVINGGKSGGAALRLDRATDVTHTLLSRSAGMGIRKDAGDSTDYAAAAAGNTFDMCAMGNIGP